LHAPEAGAAIEDEVVAFAVSPWLSGVEAEGAGFEQEGGFGKFTGALGVAVDGLDFGRGGPARVFDSFHGICAFRSEKKKRSYWLRLYISL